MDTLNNLISKFKQEIQKKFWVDKSVQKIYNDIIQQITTIQIPNDKEKFKQEKYLARLGAELNCHFRICNPAHYHYVTQPKKKITTNDNEYMHD